MATFKQMHRGRKLEERSHLRVEFPQEDNRVFRTYIPFLENPIITERGQSNLNQYDLIGRAGSLFSYAGSPSREISLTFNISLVHMLHSQYFEGIAKHFHRSFNMFFSDKERTKKMFRLKKEEKAADAKAEKAQTAEWEARATEITNEAEPWNATFSPDVGGYASDTQEATDAFVAKGAEIEGLGLGKNTPEYDAKGAPHASTHRAHYRSLITEITGSQPTPFIDGIVNSFTEFLGEEGISTPEEDENRLDKMIDLVYVWLNLVRATTLNNARNTVQGPPIVRLTHGPMYNNVPCVVDSYNIAITEEAGYELETLTPKGLKITMSLKELRTGNFGSFEAGEVETGDNLVGWEAIIDNNNIDPYNGDVKLVT